MRNEKFRRIKQVRDLLLEDAQDPSEHWEGLKQRVKDGKAPEMLISGRSVSGIHLGWNDGAERGVLQTPSI
jgi:hypothetical protein